MGTLRALCVSRELGSFLAASSAVRLDEADGDRARRMARGETRPCPLAKSPEVTPPMSPMLHLSTVMGCTTSTRAALLAEMLQRGLSTGSTFPAWTFDLALQDLLLDPNQSANLSANRLKSRRYPTRLCLVPKCHPRTTRRTRSPLVTNGPSLLSTRFSKRFPAGPWPPTLLWERLHRPRESPWLPLLRIRHTALLLRRLPRCPFWIRPRQPPELPRQPR